VSATHCARLLAVLQDGQPHDHLSLYRLGMIVHSRVSDLRKRGHLISQWRDGDTYYYQLLPEPGAGEPRPGAHTGTADGTSRAPIRARAGASPAPAQLTLEAA
jgi:hypothetical protein